MQVTFLGTGTSVGVPRIGCDCTVCISDNPRNNRLRCAILIVHEDRNILVDTPPDYRTQALLYDIRRLDAVVFTHAHADHLHGLDDVRTYCLNRDEGLPCYADLITVERIKRVFDYALNSPWPRVPKLNLHTIDGPSELFGLPVQPLTVMHGKLPVQAFRIGTFAYVTDCSVIPDDTMAALEGVDTLVLDALRHREHPTHLNVEQALEVVESLKPRQTYLTHIAHDLEHEATNASLPDGVELAYDGLTLNLPTLS